MASDLVTIGFKADATGIKQAKSELDRLAKSGGTVDKSVVSVEKSFTGLNSTLRTATSLFAALGVTMSARELVQYSDEWKNVNSQLRQVTDSEKELIATRKQLLALSTQTRSDLTNTVDLYAQITRSTKDLGVSSTEVMGITRTLNNLFVAGGKPISEVEGAIRQLNQGFAAGALRGDEFNSVAEGAPKIMDALGKALKMTRGELREFAATGGITAGIMVSALKDYNVEAQRMADQTEKTFGQSMTNSSTNTLKFIGSLDKLNGTVSAVGNTIESVTADLGVYSDNVEAWVGQFAGINDDINNTLSQSSDTFSRELIALSAITDETLKFLGASIMQFPQNIRAMTKILTVELASAVDIVAASGRAFGASIGVQLGLMVDIAKIRTKAFGDTIAAEVGVIIAKSKVYGKQIKDGLNPFDGDTFDFDAELALAEKAGATLTAQIKSDSDLRVMLYKKAASDVTNSAFETAENQITASRSARIAVITDALAQKELSLKTYKELQVELKKIRDESAVVSVSGSSNSSFSLPVKTDEVESNSKEITNLIDQVDNLGGAWSNTSDTIAQAMGDIVSGLTIYGSKMEDIISLETKLKAERDLSTTSEKDKIRISASLADLEAEATRTQLSGISQIAGASASLFSEQSKERKALNKAEQVFTAIEIALAIKKASVSVMAGAAKFFEQTGWAGFAGVTAMLGVMSGLGFSGGSSGGATPSAVDRQESQGTGTVLGAENEVSESIVNSLEMLEDIGVDNYAVLSDMRDSVKDLNNNITSLASTLVRNFGSFDAEGYGGQLGNIDTTSSLEGGLIGTLVSSFDPVGLFSGIIGGFSSTKKTLMDSGVSILSQTMKEIIDTGLVSGQQYFDIKTRKEKAWGLSSKTTYSTEFESLDNDIQRELGLLFESMGTSINSAVDLLGIGVEQNLNDFEIEIPNISLKDMTGDEITEALQSVFSNQADLMATYLVPGLAEFQTVGTTLYETLIRLAHEQATFDSAIDSMGISLGDLSNVMRIDVAQSVIELMGGLEEFSSATNSYVDNFFTDAEKTEKLGKSLGAVFEDLGIPLTTTADGFRALIEGLDLTNKADQEIFTTLMSLNPAMSEYIDMLDAQAEAMNDLAGDALDGLIASVDAEKERIALALAGAQDIYTAEIERINGVRDALDESFDLLTSNLDNAKDAMSASFDAQIQQIMDASALRVEQLQAEMTASTEYHQTELDFLSAQKTAANEMISGLTSASGNLRGFGGVDTDALSNDLVAALSAAQTGSFGLAMGLGNVSDLYQDASGFSSAADMNVQNATTGFRANELANLVDGQLSVEERMLAALEQQVINEDIRYDKEQSLLSDRIEKEQESAEAQVAALESQLNNLLGINEGVLSLDASIIAFKMAQDELNDLDYERELEALAQQEDWAMEALDVAEQASDAQVSALDAILSDGYAQLNALNNVNASVLTVTEAVKQLELTIQNAESAQAARDVSLAKETTKSANSLQQIVTDGVQTEAIA